VTLKPGSRHLLYDVDRAQSSAPAILASACKTLGEEKSPDGGFRFYAEGPDKIEAVVRLRLAKAPESVTIDDHALPADARNWEQASHTLLLRFPNSAKGRWLTVR
jgi:hypothetical protein